MHELGFPWEIRLTHWFNALFLTLLVRSGLAILSAHPKLYWNVHAWPTSEWLDLLRKPLPNDRMWCSTDEEGEWPAWLALPGGDGLGLGRYWHFTAAPLWVICGICYVATLFTSEQWRRLVPTSWEIFPCAWQTLLAYLQLKSPEPHPPFTYESGLPFNALQQLTYFGAIFFLTPFQIVTGAFQSPAMLAHFPWIERLLGNRQSIRSLHFIGLVSFLGFLSIHLVMVFWHGFAVEMDKMVLGRTHTEGSVEAVWWGIAVIGAIVLFHVAANLASAYAKRSVHWALSLFVKPWTQHLLYGISTVHQRQESEISPYHRTNGYPPISAYPQAKGDDDTFERLLANSFHDYQLEVTGLVRRPLRLSLDDLKAMPKQEQITLHNCIQGWTSVGKWGGVRVSEILDRCRPLPEAKYLVFRSFGMHEKSDQHYYECVSIKVGRYPETILAYELNGEPLPLQHGAPLRPRFETKLGFKMVKFLRSIEVVDDYRKIGDGMGGIREDKQQFDKGAEI